MQRPSLLCRLLCQLLCLPVLSLLVCPATAQSYRGQDTAVGGIAGAIIGGIIGHQNDETPEGALIGGALGAIAGNIVGDAKDQQVRHQRIMHHQAWAHRQQQVGRAVSIVDVVNMSRSGLSDAVILNQIRSNGVTDHVGTHEVISMHNSGVSENVIAAMQQSRIVTDAAPRPAFVPAPPPRPVIVRKEVRFLTRPAYQHPHVQCFAPPYPHPPRARYYRVW